MPFAINICLAGSLVVLLACFNALALQHALPFAPLFGVGQGGPNSEALTGWAALIVAIGTGSVGVASLVTATSKALARLVVAWRGRPPHPAEPVSPDQPTGAP